MNTAQRIIKGFAIGLAVLIIVSIAGMILSAVGTLGLIADEFSGNKVGPMETVNLGGDDESQTVKRLDVSVKATRVWVKLADAGVSYQTNNEYIDVWEENGTMHVVERSHGVFGFGGTGELTIYLDNKMALDEIKLEIGAGTLSAQSLVAKRIELELGAGKTEIEYLKASEALRIDGGAGVLTVHGGEAENAEIEIGAGKADLRLRLMGKSRIDTGVGKTDLTLVGEEKDYRLSVDKGIGSVSYNGRSLADNAREGDGANTIKIESGVGAVEIRTAER